MLIVLAGGLLLIIIFGPSLWVNHVLKRYSAERPDLAGTGGQFAEHLLGQLHLQQVKVESDEQADYYDPQQKRVCLTGDKFNGRSLTAVVVAAHEVGHAHQHASHYAPFHWRTRIVGLYQVLQKLSIGIILIAPVLTAITRMPSVGGGLLLVAAAGMLLGVLVQLVTLPVEWNASFSRALPILEAGNYLSEQDMPAARKILLAAALTYVAGALVSMLSFYRWVAVLRR